MILFSAASFSLGVGPVVAQSSVSEVMSVCSPVIETEYAGDRTPWGRCVAAVETHLNGQPDSVVDLVVALTELYRFDTSCRISETELPIAIARAGDFAADGEQRAQILLIRNTIAECDEVRTAAIVEGDRPASAF